MRFAEGRGVPMNLTEAARWFERARPKGPAPAQFRYASMLEKGQGVKKDLPQARRLYLAAAAKGNAKAMHNLAVLYAEGIDGKPDYATAAKWFRKAAARHFRQPVQSRRPRRARARHRKELRRILQMVRAGGRPGRLESAKKRDEVATRLDPQALAAAQQAVKSFVAEPQPEEADRRAGAAWRLGTAQGAGTEAAGAGKPKAQPRRRRMPRCRSARSPSENGEQARPLP